MPDAKFESDSFSSFGDMTSQNFPLKKGTSYQIQILTREEMGLPFKKCVFMCRIVLVYPKLTPCQFQQFQAEENFFIPKIFETSQ